MKQDSNIQIEIENNIATLTICREKQLNALNQSVLNNLSIALDKLAEDSTVRVLIITGQGNRSFVAGADIKEFQHFNTKEGYELAKNGQENVFDKIENFSKPIIAAVNGYALGGGLELAIACHIRVASESAKLGFPECSLGLIPGYGGTQRLGQLIGKGNAFEMILTGSMLNADKSEKIGLVNKVSDDKNILIDAKKIAQKCIKNSPKALNSAIKCINNSFYRNGFESEKTEFSKLFNTDDFKEGVLAFLEKRRPNY
tara:strand:- start:677 stop:1447 length:771 start_codon:yes stop_codon:yes gene_type:complete